MSSSEVNAKACTVTLHVVASLDGFIAKHDKTVSWIASPGDVYEKGISEADADHPNADDPNTPNTDDPSANDSVTSIDCFVLGSRTYEHALQLGWPYGDTPTVVVTNRKLPSTRKTVEFYSGDLKKLVHEVLAPRYLNSGHGNTGRANIWLVGGAMLCQSFLKLGLVDEIRLMIAPVILGDGLPLFADSGAEQKWHLTNVVGYKNGYVELAYRRPPTGAAL